MLGASTTLYLLALLSTQPAFIAALVQIEHGLIPQLPRDHYGRQRRSGGVPTVLRGAEEAPLGSSSPAEEGSTIVARQRTDGSVTSGRQTLGTVAG